MSAALTHTRKAKPPEVGERIKMLRENLGASQRDISGSITSYAYISRIEAGARNPSIEALIELAEHLQTTALYLLSGDEHGPCPVCRRGEEHT